MKGSTHAFLTRVREDYGMRSIWSGALSFGLINIPVKLYAASEERALKFRMLDKNGHCPISYARVCRAENREVPYEDIVKGYEYQKGEYVILTDEDFAKAAPRKTGTVDILHFVDEDEVPSEYIEKPYFIEPETSAQKAYVLLRDALARSKKVGIATWVLRNKERVAMVKPDARAIMLIQLRYKNELRDKGDLNIPKEAKHSKKELDMALALIQQLEEHFDPSEYKDTYTDDLKKLIARKAKGQTVRVSKDTTPTPTDMRNLMRMLKKSLDEEKRAERGGRKRAHATV